MHSKRMFGLIRGRLSKRAADAGVFAAIGALSIFGALRARGQTSPQAQHYDVVIANGRVMDPETRLDAVRNVGITGGKIAAISAAPLGGRTMLDAKGLVVAPGFIDMHEHGQEERNYEFQAHDGVTTSLE
ncbi:MAG TPA: hypothetical protein VJS43_16260, partial [Candidatus Acidoferrales bacterium]|nr:hypothetical protein [Candidatus Acidoferrales bacterium]